MASLSNFVRSVTRDQYLPVVIDNVYAGNALFMRLRNKRKNWGSGAQFKMPTEVKERTTGGSYSGADTFDTNQEDTRVQFSVDPKQYYANATITGIQRAANTGREAIVDLIQSEMESITEKLRQDMGTDLYADGTGNFDKALTGLVAHVDDGTNVTTYQGQSRTTYPRLKSTLTTQSGALALSDLAADFDAAQVGDDSPTLGVTTPAVFTIYEALLTATVSYNVNQDNGRFTMTAAGIENGGITANAGFTGLYFRGVPVVSDDKCTSGNLYFLNEKYLDLYEMNQDPMFTESARDGFGWTGWKKPTNQDVIVGQLLWYGNLIGKQPRKHSRRTSITS